jgi:hypothetical protein
VLIIPSSWGSQLDGDFHHQHRAASAMFVNLNPFMQHMFLKLHDIEDSEKKDFILETSRREFRDVVIEARKVF